MATESHIIKVGDHVLFQMPSEQTKVVKLDKAVTVNLGKFGSFDSSKLIGHPFGLTYEIDGTDIKVMSPTVVKELEETQATNEYINDGEFVQPLTYEEIEDLKKTGANASEIIDKQISQHANYSLKTEYSKEKYKKRKEAKFGKRFRTLQPTVPNLLDHQTAKDASKVMHLRMDSLAQMLTFANVREGGRYIVVEDCGGLLTGAILERMGGQGRLFTIHDADSPPAHNLLYMMNLPPELLAPLAVLNWATADETHTPVLPPAITPEGKNLSDRERRRLEKRRDTINQLASYREELFAGGLDGLLSASQYEPLSIVQRMEKYLAGSANVLLYSPYCQVLTEVQSQLRATPGWLNLSLTEGWLRRYQVLPGRTHPHMNMQGSGGYLLHAIKVYDDPTASSFLFGEATARKRRKLTKVAAKDGEERSTRSESMAEAEPETSLTSSPAAHANGHVADAAQEQEAREPDPLEVPDDARQCSPTVRDEEIEPISEESDVKPSFSELS